MLDPLMRAIRVGNLTENWLHLCSITIIIAYAVVLIAFFSIGKWIIGDHGTPLHQDFAWLYTAGHFAATDNPVSAYDIPTFSAVESDLTRLMPFPGLYSPRWGYPPTLFFVAGPISELPYTLGFLVWVFATISL